uniref:Glycosyltransferase family 92 protein n=1 Tax=Caenorhabditis japonica TaxID=281687 RepID=A0A8R1HZY4_CAEJA
MNPCATPNEYIIAEIGGKNQTKRVKLKGEATEGECPWHWASQCLYNSYIWTADVEVEKWMSETWRAQGANKFIVYFHSSTKEVRMLLEYYQNMGLIDVKPWPSFGTPAFDASTYRVGHTLAQNLCILEMRSELGAVADFDEVMVTESGILRDYVEGVMMRSNVDVDVVGALRFNHLLVKFEPKIATMDFSGVRFPVFLDRNGPPKVVFNSSTVDIIGTHSVRKFIGNQSIIPASGSLLHYRHNSYTENAARVEKDLTFFPSTPLFHLRRIQKSIRTVFAPSTPFFNSTFLHALTECIAQIVGEGKCRSTVSFCSQRMTPLTDWVHANGNGVFLGS